MTGLRAFFDSEAYVHPKGKIRVESVNGKGLKEVQKLLLSLGIQSKLYL